MSKRTFCQYLLICMAKIIALRHNDDWDDQIELEYHKPTHTEREKLTLNNLQTHNVKPLNI